MSKTHWKKLHNPDYLGSWALQPGQDLIVTIDCVREETIVGTDGKKEEAMLMHFREREIKPMIVNTTNSKSIEKLFKTPYVEDWASRKIQLFVTTVKAFGDTVDALRVRPFLPKITETEIKCAECKKVIDGYGTMDASQMAAFTQKKYGQALCSDCATKRKEAAKNSGAL